ncbi:hypothetical protein OAL29_00065 [Candidatus Binatia bacterium]|nr:hypothetical protein [Candidatus Binatia bacterium]
MSVCGHGESEENSIKDGRYIEDLVEEMRFLGQARIILRNALGASELFADLADLQVRDGWIHIVNKKFHIHLSCADIARVRFCERHQYAHEAPTISFLADQGGPSVVLTFDQLAGAEAQEQANEVRGIARRHEDETHLVSEHTRPAMEDLH